MNYADVGNPHWPGQGTPRMRETCWHAGQMQQLLRQGGGLHQGVGFQRAARILTPSISQDLCWQAHSNLTERKKGSLRFCSHLLKYETLNYGMLRAISD